MRLLVTGGSSFVGAHFCLRARVRHDVVAIHHSTPLSINGITPLKEDLRTPRSHRRLGQLGVDAVVHMATKVKGAGAPKVNHQMMDAVLSLGVPVVYASSTVVHWHTPTPYGDSRLDDEGRLAESGLPWVTVRPSAPYGPRLKHHVTGHKESFHTLAEWVRFSPFIPVIGDGEYRRQPIHVDDFSDAILALLEKPLPNRAFDAGGGEALSFNEIISLMAEAKGRDARVVHLPKSIFVMMARMHGNFDADLIRAVDEDELADSTELSEITGTVFRTFRKGVRCLI